MYHPYQCLDIRPRDLTEPGGILHAASGPQILLLNLGSGSEKDKGSIISSWSAESSASSVENNDDRAEEPPGKKRKISTPDKDPPNVIQLVTTVNDPRVRFVAVTAEDKCVRAFEVDFLDEEHSLRQLSQRCMQKRPCAVAIENQTILCADKSGDVYGMPLHNDLEGPWQATIATQKSSKAAPKKISGPSATNLTVHSARNRRALEHQLKHQGQQTKTKEQLDFPHALLLGHVSMLTDIVITSLLQPDPVDYPHTYIFTSDRDEHIRISRGPPQTHIIEGYCLGHEDFVSKLCVLDNELLVSGGGDDYLFLWRWRECRLLNKINLKKAVIGFLRTLPDNVFAIDGSVAEFKIAVSGLWSFPAPNTGPEESSYVLVACEGISAIFCFSVEAMRNPGVQAQPEVIALPGNILDVAVTEGWMVVSIDNVHKANSTTELRPGQDLPLRLHGFKFVAANPREAWKPSDELNKRLATANATKTVPWSDKTGRELLYGVESLRKRGSEE